MRVYFEDWTPLFRVPVEAPSWCSWWPFEPSEIPLELMEAWAAAVRQIQEVQRELALYDPEAIDVREAS